MELLNVLLGKYSVLEFARTLHIIAQMSIRTKRLDYILMRVGRWVRSFHKYINTCAIRIVGNEVPWIQISCCCFLVLRDLRDELVIQLTAPPQNLSLHYFHFII